MTETEIIDVDDKTGITSNEHAAGILKHLWCVEPHSPTACADWIPPHLNTYERCLAWIKTDIGFVLRKQPKALLTNSAEANDELSKSEE